MALVGKSLDKLIAERPSRRFSPGTAIGISIQMVNALRALHQIGYLHRDIKPANTTIGRPEDGETRVIYLLDFGMARRYTRPDVSRNDCFCAKPPSFFAGHSSPAPSKLKFPRLTTLRSHLRTYQPRVQPQGRHWILVRLAARLGKF